MRVVFCVKVMLKEGRGFSTQFDKAVSDAVRRWRASCAIAGTVRDGWIFGVEMKRFAWGWGSRLEGHVKFEQRNRFGRGGALLTRFGHLNIPAICP